MATRPRREGSKRALAQRPDFLQWRRPCYVAGLTIWKATSAPVTATFNDSTPLAIGMLSAVSASPRTSVEMPWLSPPKTQTVGVPPVSYTHLTLPTIYSV